MFITLHNVAWAKLEKLTPHIRATDYVYKRSTDLGIKEHMVVNKSSIEWITSAHEEQGHTGCVVRMKDGSQFHTSMSYRQVRDLLVS